MSLEFLVCKIVTFKIKMADNNLRYERQLKQTCRLTGARWAVWLEPDKSGWDIGVQHALNQTRLAALREFLSQPNTSHWLAGAFSTGRVRSRSTGNQARTLGSERVFIFPNLAEHAVLVVGADQLTRREKEFYRILSESPPFEAIAEIPLDDRLLLRPLEVEFDTTYNLSGVLERILQYLVKLVSCDAALIAIRRGETFSVDAVWELSGNFDLSENFSVSLQEDVILDSIVNTRKGLVIEDLTQEERLELKLPESGGYLAWMGVPVLIGRQVTGLVVFLSKSRGTYASADLSYASSRVKRVAHGIEGAIVFSETARYLQQMALLNELASAASVGVDVYEVAHRVRRMLSRTFRTDLVSVLLLSDDRGSLREYTDREHPDAPLAIPVDESLVGYVAETGMPLRVADIQQAPRYLDMGAQVRSVLAVPLKYRGDVIGVLDLESTEASAFTHHDQQLLVVIASHLAALLENVRLNAETHMRLRNLQATRDTALDVSADLDLDVVLSRVVHRSRQLVDAEGAELGLVDEKQGMVTIVVSELPWEDTTGSQIELTEGITGKVAALGEPLIIADYRAWDGAAEKAPVKTLASVPLKHKDKVIGVLTVSDSRPDRQFVIEDVQLLELLAPQIAISIHNAQLYKELQEHIEAQRLAENRLIRTARLAAVGEMAAGVAHELNNPLTTVTGFVELVLEELPGELPQKADLELVLREARRARGVVRQLLDFSRPVENLRELTDLNEIIADVLALVNHLVRTNGVQMNVELEEHLPEIRLDPNQIKQVVLNLVHNALQSMPLGGELTVKTCESQRDGRRWLNVLVQDTGEGITSENLDRIFEPFFTTREPGSGTGLGLSVSYGIVTDHGGYIEVESQNDQGSCFTVWLPENYSS